MNYIRRRKVKKKKRILFLFTAALSTFKERDLEMLRKHFDVRTLHYKGLIKSFFEILRGVLWADLTFSWFAGEYAFLAALFAKIFRKKSIVVAGGGEVAQIPEIGYGGILNLKTARRVKLALKHSDKVLAVSEFNKKELLKYTDPKKVETVYNAVNYNKFKPVGEKEDLVITVAPSLSDTVIKRKGLETYIKAAKHLPGIKFMLIGRIIDDSFERLKSIAILNVEFVGFVSSEEEIINYYQMAKVYCQLSLYETFGVALAEAMLCECVPVVTNIAALPEVVGDTGFYVPYGDVEATAEAIKKALNSDTGKEARDRIKNLFPMQRRERELLAVINGLIPPKR